MRPRRGLHIPASARVALVVAATAACAPPRAPARDSEDALVGPLERTFAVPSHADRDYILHLPPDYDGAAPLPVVVGFHGGGGRKEGFDRTGCRDGDEAADNCLTALADREGFAVVMPDGLDGSGLGARSWNAGGGADGFRCVGGKACSTASDDVAYVDALLAEVLRAVNVDEDRVYATGISNGGAMSHRLACERADVFAAIAPVAGANQVQAAPGCAPSRPVPVLHIHGTNDRCWGFDGGAEARACDDSGEGRFVSAPESMAGWQERNGCTGVVEEPLPDAAEDGMTTTRLRATGCAADTVLLRVDGGGHTWPDGWQYLSANIIGPVTGDFIGNEVIWEFFEAHPRPARE